jgi:imidazolonepropionase-like amidohydrolase
MNRTNADITAIVGGTVLDGTGRPPAHDTVLIEGGRIRAVTSAGEAPPEHARVIDATGRHIIPGLLDANVHLTSPIPDVVLEHEGRYPELIIEAAQLTLRAGVTTVFDTCGHLASLVTARNRINGGQAIGSRIFLAGYIIGFGGPFSTDMYSPGAFLGPDLVNRINHEWEQGVGADLLWLPPDGVRRRVRDYIERSDIDFVKYAASGHAAHRQFIAFSERTQRAIVEEAHRANLTAQAHSTTVESLWMQIDAGADLLQHGNYVGPEPMPEETLRLIVERQIPVAAIIHTRRYREWVHRHGPGLSRLVYSDAQEATDQRLIDAGARLLLTTDGLVIGPGLARHPILAAAAGAHTPDVALRLGEGHFLWLEAVVERGLPPMAALRAATSNVARAYGQGGDLGTIEPGKRADLVILDGDPLADVRNYRRIVEVMKDGVLVDRDNLPHPRILTDPGADLPT